LPEVAADRASRHVAVILKTNTRQSYNCNLSTAFNTVSIRYRQISIIQWHIKRDNLIYERKFLETMALYRVFLASEKVSSKVTQDYKRYYRCQIHNRPPLRPHLASFAGRDAWRKSLIFPAFITSRAEYWRAELIKMSAAEYDPNAISQHLGL